MTSPNSIWLWNAPRETAPWESLLNSFVRHWLLPSLMQWKALEEALIGLHWLWSLEQVTEPGPGTWLAGPSAKWKSRTLCRESRKKAISFPREPPSPPAVVLCSFGLRSPSLKHEDTWKVSSDSQTPRPHRVSGSTVYALQLGPLQACVQAGGAEGRVGGWWQPGSRWPRSRWGQGGIRGGTVGDSDPPNIFIILLDFPDKTQIQRLNC